MSTQHWPLEKIMLGTKMHLVLLLSHAICLWFVYPLTDDWNANTEIDLGSESDSDFKSNYSFATATSQSKSNNSMDSDSDSESKCDIDLPSASCALQHSWQISQICTEDAVTFVGKKKITSQVVERSLRWSTSPSVLNCRPASSNWASKSSHWNLTMPVCAFHGPHPQKETVMRDRGSRSICVCNEYWWGNSSTYSCSPPNFWEPLPYVNVPCPVLGFPVEPVAPSKLDQTV